jgi:hypothetical protein
VNGEEKLDVSGADERIGEADRGNLKYGMTVVK